MKPAVAMLLASFGFAAMSVFVKLGAAHFSTAEMVFWRSAIGTIAMALMLPCKAASRSTRPSRRCCSIAARSRWSVRPTAPTPLPAGR
jgi:drug/metabolite transporter (DMT)-like permease